jgi:hypothetical protein
MVHPFFISPVGSRDGPGDHALFFVGEGESIYSSDWLLKAITKKLAGGFSVG